MAIDCWKHLKTESGYEVLVQDFRPRPPSPLLIHNPSDLLFSHLWNGYSDAYTVDSKEQMSDPSTMAGSGSYSGRQHSERSRVCSVRSTGEE